MEKTIKVTGMHCKSCEVLLSEVLSEIAGVSKISVDHKFGIVKLAYSNEKTLIEAKKVIELHGYKVS